MNKSILKFVTDIGPLAIFFLFYYKNDKNLINSFESIFDLLIKNGKPVGGKWSFDKDNRKKRINDSLFFIL